MNYTQKKRYIIIKIFIYYWYLKTRLTIFISFFFSYALTLAQIVITGVLNVQVVLNLELYLNCL